MSAADNSQWPIRPTTATLGGYRWLPRLIDKARAHRSGTLAAGLVYPCLIDRACLESLGTDAERFADLVASCGGDHEVLAVLETSGLAGSAAAAFDPDRYL
ncbi:MAG: DUF5069 domain-containing protein [Actinobacteria bacterium]|nr:DUF5069 domain-containing protein [Actinomycetota bacterium]